MFSDFDIITFGDTGQANGSWSGSGAGVGTVNSSLTSPLANDGTFCRELDAVTTDTFSSNNFIVIKSTAASGAFDAVPNTKALSIRAAVRLASPIGNGIGPSRFGEVGIIVKAVPRASGSGIAAGTFAGYKLRAAYVPQPNGFFGGGIEIWLSAHRADGTSGALGNPGNIEGPNLSINTWVNLRMDVTPQGSGGDLIQGFTAPPGSTPDAESWTSIGSISVPSSSDVFQPWGSSTQRHGMYAYCNHAATGSDTYRMYLDRFRAAVAPV